MLYAICKLTTNATRKLFTRTLTWFVWEHYERKELLKATDERLKGEYNAKEIERVIFVELWCAHPVASNRPDIGLARSVSGLRIVYCPYVLPNYPRLLSERAYGGRSTTELSNTTGTSMWSSEEVV
ncbi:L-type lectin-domain containing receptor kinase S.6 [Carex littledalei]|uniref:L-type lectin-domain containing receptor kinase S.6 n=1 Tax=Carex littledalei TaxID=544730 RepID=A0A833QWE3_9POAL|nr:L-type lectin-domain containing receptor kinase S.6 [Carex littledalei]